MRVHRAVIGLDRDGDDLYLAEVCAGREGATLCAAARLEPADSGGAAAFLGGERRRGRFTARAGAMALPGSEAFAKDLELPPLSPSATGAAAMAALEDRLPFPRAELCLACERPGRVRTVRASVARRAVVEEHRAFLASAGLQPGRLYPRPAALAAAFRFAYGREALGRVVLLELRAGESAAVFLEDGRLRHAHPLPGLGREGTADFAALCADLRLALGLMRGQPSWEGPISLWFTGPGAHRPGVREGLAEVLGFEPAAIRPAVPRGLLRRPGLPEPGPEAMVPIGLCLMALGLEEAPPDLLARLAAARRIGGDGRALAVPLGLAFLLILAASRLLAGAALRTAAAGEAWLAGKEGELARLRRCQEESAALAARLRTLTEFGADSGTPLEFLLALAKVVPAGTRLTKVSLAGDRVEAVEGVTPSLSLLLERLEGEPLLAGLRLHGRATSAAGEDGGESFVLVGSLPGGGGRR